MTTFNTSTRLAGLRRGKIFTKKIRDTIADFAPTIGVLVGCLVTQLAKTHKGEALPTLLIPKDFSTTLGRPWLVNIFDLPVWVSLLIYYFSVFCFITYLRPLSFPCVFTYETNNRHVGALLSLPSCPLSCSSWIKILLSDLSTVHAISSRKDMDYIW